MFEFAPANFFTNKKVILEIASHNGAIFMQLPYAMKLDRDIALACVKQNGMMLAYIPYEFQNSIEFVNAAIAQTTEAIKFIPKEMIVAAMKSYEEKLNARM